VERNRYADLLRVLAISLVITGHWLLTDVVDRGGQLSGRDALGAISWSGWATLFFQVMPIFFVVGGYANATSWTAHRQAGQGWTQWMRHRALRLLWPTTVYVAIAAVVVAASRIAGAPPAALALGGWLVALQLWFLPVYLLLIAMTPLLLAAHRRWGIAVPAAMTLAAAGVDAGVLGPHLPLLGFANYLLVWGTMHQWGFGWWDRSLTRPRWRPYALAFGGAATLAGLLAWSPFPVDMIGFGGAVDNTTPPSIALLAFAAAQTGLILAAEPAMSRALARARLWRPVSRLNELTMTLYLWHMVPVIIVAVTLYPRGLLPQPGIGSARWWELRPAWLVLLAAVLVPLVAGARQAERPLRRLTPGPGVARPWSAAVLLAGLAILLPALARLAIFGFAPGGRLPLLALAGYGCALALVLLCVRPGSAPMPREIAWASESAR
jgi:fucose 4-O-acetylase-like acetyltransferase